MDKKEINVFEVVKGPAAISTDDGEALYAGIAPLLEKGAEVTLNFINIEAITSTFLNAAIGQLYSKFDSPFLRKYLKVQNLDSVDTDLLIRVIERAKDYFSDKEKIDRTIEESLDE